MNSVALPRIAFPNLPMGLEEFGKLSRKISSELDYTPAHTYYRRLTVLQTFQKLGCMPFEVSAVRQYKREKQAAARKGLWRPSKRLAWYWRECWLSQYKAPIPLEVLQMALQLKNESALHLEMRVHYLHNEDLHENVVDPFLVVEGYFIAVWDEPGFQIK